jgi:hypothetical protein
MHLFLSNWVATNYAWQIGMWGAALALIAALLLFLVNTYVNKNLPTDLREKKWVDMNEEEFSRCGFYGIAGLLTGTASIPIFASVLGWTLPLCTVFYFFATGHL